MGDLGYFWNGHIGSLLNLVKKNNNKVTFYFLPASFGWYHSQQAEFKV
jgi:hypothetical protein